MDIRINPKYNVMRLQQYLDYELSTSVLFLLVHVWALCIFLMTAAAVIFAPFMLWVMYQERKFAWIAWFGVIVTVPLIAMVAVDFEAPWTSIFGLCLLALFYIYCFFLRAAVRDWDE